MSKVDLYEIAESIPYPVWIVAPDGLTQYLNRVACDYTGLSAGSYEGRSWQCTMHPDDVPRVSREWARALATATPCEIDCRIRRSDGQYRWHAFKCLPRRGPDGNVVRWTGTAADVDDRKRLEAQLSLSERQSAERLSILETLQSTAPCGFAFVDRDLCIVALSETLASGCGCLVRERPEGSLADVIPAMLPDVAAFCRRVLDTGAAVMNVETNSEAAADSGPKHRWLASYHPVRLADEIIGVAIVAIDVAERAETEAARDGLMRNVIGAIAAIQARDLNATEHQQRVSDIAASLARELDLDDRDVEGIRLAATIHDIGHISLPSEMLTRPAKLRPAEWGRVKTHPRTGYDVVAGIDFPWPIAQMILQHHERGDGSGYPNHLRGDEILLGARIIGVADTLDAMTSDRPFQPARGLEAALGALRDGRGTRYDAAVVDACLRLYAAGRLGAEDTAGMADG